MSTKYNGLTAMISEGLSFRDVLTVLHTIAQTDSFEKAKGKEAKDLLDTFCKFENILTAFVFLRVFKITAPLSLYLQKNVWICCKR